MSREKNQKLELKLQNKDYAREVESAEPTDNKNTISFDIYFRKIMARDPKILPHHKAAMRKYAEQKGFVEADEEDFDEIFRIY